MLIIKKKGLSMAQSDSHNKALNSSFYSSQPINRTEFKTDSKNRNPIRLLNSLEQSRYLLQHQLCNTEDNKQLLLNKCRLLINQGRDKSEIMSSCHNMTVDKSIQDIIFVQPKDFQETHSICSKVDFSTIHFLPTFLIDVASEILKSSKHNPDRKNHGKLLNKTLKQVIHYRDQLVIENMGLINFAVNKHFNSQVPFEDLQQEGTIGLIKAIDRFDTSRPVKFSTYALYWIRQTISRCLIRQKNIIRLPYNLAPKAAEVFDVITSQLQETQIHPSLEEIAEICKIEKKDAENIINSYQPMCYLSDHLNNDPNKPCLMDTIEQKAFASPEENTASEFLTNILTQALTNLSEQEAHVVCTRFGVNNTKQSNLQDIATQFSVSKERIRQIQNNSLKKIRSKYSETLSDYLIA